MELAQVSTTSPWGWRLKSCHVQRHLNVDGPFVLCLSSAQPTDTVTGIKPYSIPNRQLEIFKRTIRTVCNLYVMPQFWSSAPRKIEGWVVLMVGTMRSEELCIFKRNERPGDLQCYTASAGSTLNTKMKENSVKRSREMSSAEGRLPGKPDLETLLVLLRVPIFSAFIPPVN